MQTKRRTRRMEKVLRGPEIVVSDVVVGGAVIGAASALGLHQDLSRARKTIIGAVIVFEYPEFLNRIDGGKNAEGEVPARHRIVDAVDDISRLLDRCSTNAQLRLATIAGPAGSELVSAGNRSYPGNDGRERLKIAPVQHKLRDLFGRDGSPVFRGLRLHCDGVGLDG